jgi:hypothetical protein
MGRLAGGLCLAAPQHGCRDRRLGLSVGVAPPCGRSPMRADAALARLRDVHIALPRTAARRGATNLTVLNLRRARRSERIGDHSSRSIFPLGKLVSLG